MRKLKSGATKIIKYIFESQQRNIIVSKNKIIKFMIVALYWRFNTSFSELPLIQHECRRLVKIAIFHRILRKPIT